MITLLYKSKQFFFVLIKLGIVLLAFYFIYDKLRNNEGLEYSFLFKLLNNNWLFSINFILTLVTLSTLNWFLEILKWQTLASHIKNLTFYEATKQCLSSLTASIFTPNRIGEYGAKAMFFKSKLRKKILFVNFLGNIMQLCVTIFFGLFGVYFFIENHNSPIDFKSTLHIMMGLFFISFTGIVFFKRILFRRIKIHRTFFYSLPKKIWQQTVFYSVIRYLVFSLQFYFLLQFFDVALPYLNSMVFISSTYLLVSIIPNIVILDVVVKGGAAVYLFSFAEVNESTILYIITIMWLFNFVIPCIIGSYYVLNYKYNNAIIKV